MLLTPRRFFTVLLVPGTLFCCLVSKPAPAQTTAHSAAPKNASAHSLPQRSPRDWAILACNNEIAATTHEGSYFRYRVHVVDQHENRVRDVIESKDGTVARTVMQDGRPLSPEEDQAERRRLQELAASPAEFAKHVKSDTAGKKLAIELLHAMPDAMIYTPLPDETSSSGARLLVFHYEPNPQWTPPTTTSEALTGLRGRVWLDASTGYVTRMEGEIFRPVNIGWGMLAHVFPGGQIAIEQANIGGTRWIYSHFSENVHVRALMVKSIDVSSEVSTSNYQQLPGPMTYQQAIDLLLR